MTSSPGSRDDDAPVTVFYGDAPATSVRAREDGEHLWMSAADLQSVTGWTLKPEGLCREESCVPLPADGSWVDARRRLDLTAFARRFGRPAVGDGDHHLWAFGESAQARREQDLSTRAPEFTLPDLDGRRHALSDFRGQKVFLLAWGSY